MNDITLKKIQYKNWMGLPDLVIAPGWYTEISGSNGQGKTSAIEGLRYMVRTGKKFHDPSVIGPRGKAAEINVEFSDGYKLRVVVKPTASTRTVTDERGHEVTRSAEHIEAICNALAVDPLAFMSIDDDKRLSAILEAVDLRVSASQLVFVPTRLLAKTSLDRHALIVLGELDKAIREERTGVGRIADEKSKTAKQLRETLPEAPPAGNWDEELARVTGEFTTLQKGTKSRILGVEVDARTAVESLRDLAQAKKDGVRQKLELEVQKLQKIAQLSLDEIDQERGEAAAKADDERKAALAAIDAEYQPQYRALNEQIAKAKAMAEQHAAAEKTRQFIASQEDEARKSKEFYDQLSDAIARLDDLRGKLSADIPIKGLEIREGEIYIDGVVWKRVNEARKYEVAAEYAILKSGAAKFIVVDNLERLDSKHHARFLEILREKGMQLIGAKVSDADLAISNESAPDVLGGQLRVSKI